MSHFYGTIQGQRGEATRCGGKSSGYEAHAAGWEGAIRTVLWFDETTQKDMFRVCLVPWGSSGGQITCLAEGILDATNYSHASSIGEVLSHFGDAVRALERYEKTQSNNKP